MDNALRERNIRMTAWSIENDAVRLEYNDGTVVYVKKADFDRAFGTIISAPKEAVIQDFAIEQN